MNTGSPSSLQERGRDSCLQEVLCYKRLFAKACVGCKRFFLKVRKNVMFLNKIDLPYCLVVFFVVCPRLRPFWSVFGELALFWCSMHCYKTAWDAPGKQQRIQQGKLILFKNITFVPAFKKNRLHPIQASAKAFVTTRPRSCSELGRPVLWSIVRFPWKHFLNLKMFTVSSKCINFCFDLNFETVL